MCMDGQKGRGGRGVEGRGVRCCGQVGPLPASPGAARATVWKGGRGILAALPEVNLQRHL